MRKGIKKIWLIAVMTILLVTVSGCGSQNIASADVVEQETEAMEETIATAKESIETEAETAEIVEEKAEKVYEELPQVSKEEVPQYEGYSLLWNDEFNGDSLNEDIWRYELHQPGWVNAELQEYTDSSDNIFVRDGRLIIKVQFAPSAGR